jgi:hypothetical protein
MLKYSKKCVFFFSQREEFVKEKYIYIYNILFPTEIFKFD